MQVVASRDEDEIDIVSLDNIGRVGPASLEAEAFGGSLG